jgi:predicted S18 family serine protease
MQYVNAEEIVLNLSGQMRRALSQAMAEALPNQEFDEALLYKAFAKAVRKQCGTWVTVPDKCVRD